MESNQALEALRRIQASAAHISEMIWKNSPTENEQRAAFCRAAAIAMMAADHARNGACGVSMFYWTQAQALWESKPSHL